MTQQISKCCITINRNNKSFTYLSQIVKSARRYKREALGGKSEESDKSARVPREKNTLYFKYSLKCSHPKQRSESVCTATTTANRLRTATSYSTAKHHRRDSDIARISAPKHHRRNDSLPKLSTAKLTERRHLPVRFPSFWFLFVSLLSPCSLLLFFGLRGWLLDIVDAETPVLKSQMAPLEP